MEKIPNWLRYLLAIPYGLLLVVISAGILTLSNLLFSDPNSLYFYISSFIFKNGLNIMIFFWGINMMLPNHRFKITLIISIIFGLAYTLLEGIGIAQNNISWIYIIAYIEVIISLIISCYLSFNKKFD